MSGTLWIFQRMLAPFSPAHRNRQPGRELRHAHLDGEAPVPELAQIRKAAGLTQSQLAALAGIGRHAVSYWEGKAAIDPNGWAMSRIAAVLTLTSFCTPIRARTSWGLSLSTSEAAWIKAQLAAVHARASARHAQRRVRCNAKTRTGKPCQCLSLPGKRRCKFHGGMSTGAKTPEGIERIREAQKRRWARWHKQTAQIR